MKHSIVLKTDCSELKLVNRGKVRDIYATDEGLILVATDRISAFDSVLSPGIAGRGEILTRLSTFWFRKFADRVPNHLLATEVDDFPAPFNSHRELAGRSVFVSRLEPIPVECVARGYLAGSGWKEYQADQKVCGIELPAGLTERELEVLLVLVRGESNKQIADHLGISAKTVGHHVQHVYQKAGVRSRAAATVWAFEHDLVHAA